MRVNLHFSLKQTQNDAFMHFLNLHFCFIRKSVTLECLSGNTDRITSIINSPASVLLYLLPISSLSPPPLSGLSSGVSGASAGEAEGDGGAESGHDHPGARHGLHGQVRLLQHSTQQ